MEEIRLSPSKLNLFNNCPRCFHDSYTDTKVPRPRGIFPTLPGGMDLIMKNYVDQYRGKLPPPLEQSLPGVLLVNIDQMNKWRHWRTGLVYRDKKNNITMIGALDDCLTQEGIYIPLDWKTKGSKPKDSGAQYYQTQLDCYNLMLDYNKYPTRDEGWLVYIYPSLAYTLPNNDPAIGVTFEMAPYKLKCNKERARELVIKAAECLRGPRPNVNGSCEYCQLVEDKSLIGLDK